MILLLVISSTLSAQKSVRKFYRNVKKSEESVKLALPGFLLHLGAGIARKRVASNPKTQLALEMTKYIKGIRIVTSSAENALSQNQFMDFLDIARHNDGFEDMISVKEGGGANINILIRGNSKKIKNLLILVKDEGEFVMLSMKTNLKYKHLNKFLEAILTQEQKIKIAPKPKETQKAITKTIKRA